MDPEELAVLTLTFEFRIGLKKLLSPSAKVNCKDVGLRMSTSLGSLSSQTCLSPTGLISWQRFKSSSGFLTLRQGVFPLGVAGDVDSSFKKKLKN